MENLKGICNEVERARQRELFEVVTETRKGRVNLGMWYKNTINDPTYLGVICLKGEMDVDSFFL